MATQKAKTASEATPKDQSQKTPSRLRVLTKRFFGILVSSTELFLLTHRRIIGVIILLIALTLATFVLFKFQNRVVENEPASVSRSTSINVALIEMLQETIATRTRNYRRTPSVPLSAFELNETAP